MTPSVSKVRICNYHLYYTFETNINVKRNFQRRDFSVNFHYTFFFIMQILLCFIIHCSYFKVNFRNDPNEIKTFLFKKESEEHRYIRDRHSQFRVGSGRLDDLVRHVCPLYVVEISSVNFLSFVRSPTTSRSKDN